MKQLTIPDTEIRVSRIGFGTASLHHVLSSRERQRLLAAADASGITHFDTSPYYGYGLAEHDLGGFLDGRRASFTVATKVGLYPRGPSSSSAATVWARKAVGCVVPAATRPVADWSVARARTSLEQSLRRLGTDYVDVLLLHEPDPTALRPEEIVAWLEAERARGTVRAWGVAGETENVEPLVVAKSPLARIVQTRDSLHLRQADFLAGHGRQMQLTYGYFSRGARSADGRRPAIDEVLRRNATGAILISTRSPERLAALRHVEA